MLNLFTCMRVLGKTLRQESEWWLWHQDSRMKAKYAYYVKCPEIWCYINKLNWIKLYHCNFVLQHNLVFKTDKTKDSKHWYRELFHICCYRSFPLTPWDTLFLRLSWFCGCADSLRGTERSTFATGKLQTFCMKLYLCLLLHSWPCIHRLQCSMTSNIAVLQNKNPGNELGIN